MSKIQILLAEEENIDDLKVPVRYGKDFYDSVQESDLERFYNAVLRRLKEDWVRDEICACAVFGIGQSDEGYDEPYLENYLDIIKEVTDSAIDELIEDTHYDLSDSDYEKIYPKLVDETADFWADFESELCNDWFNERKYEYQDDMERRGLCP